MSTTCKIKEVEWTTTRNKKNNLKYKIRKENE